MVAEELRSRISPRELIFSTSRSSGPGGQNVNKVNTKVELRFYVQGSSNLSAQEKEKILEKLNKKINADGELIVVSQSERTQLMNRKKSEEKFFKLLAAALTEKRKRRSTKPTDASRKKRLEKKKKRGSVKKLRKIFEINEE
ncbi:MAG: alternative ribosome rescue aminoacyl-tRNA hydrolase ArfB [Bacteroidia bacterium]|nr:alternative ribosome rescue aminoacyl-tRNA hydrolase ArfB [Bacteroidia bacterium]